MSIKTLYSHHIKEVTKVLGRSNLSGSVNGSLVPKGGLGNQTMFMVAWSENEERGIYSGDSTEA